MEIFNLQHRSNETEELRMRSERPVGLFDSGVGGISVLKQAIKLMPNEDFVYYGDSKNAPYGTKEVGEVRKLSFRAMDFLIDKNVKAVVVACNTATSAAIDDIRKQYKKLPVIGIEPALKPAVELKRKGRILIMATPMTLSEAKFNRQMIKFKNQADIEPLPCAGLVELIESGVFEGESVEEYLYEKLNKYLKEDIAAIVLGCTHYPFIKKELVKLTGGKVAILDGSLGTAKQLKRQLEKRGLSNDLNRKGNIEIYNSSDQKELLDISYKLLQYPL